MNRILNTTGESPSTWLLALQHVAHTLNHTASKTLGWKTPLQILTGIKPDISAIIIYQFWERVYYKHTCPKFPYNSSEMIRHFMEVAENVGHAITFKI